MCKKSPCCSCGGVGCEALYPDCSSVCPKLANFRSTLQSSLTGNALSGDFEYDTTIYV